MNFILSWMVNNAILVPCNLIFKVLKLSKVSANQANLDSHSSLLNKSFISSSFSIKNKRTSDLSSKSYQDFTSNLKSYHQIIVILQYWKSKLFNFPFISQHNIYLDSRELRALILIKCMTFTEHLKTDDSWSSILLEAIVSLYVSHIVYFYNKARFSVVSMTGLSIQFFFEKIQLVYFPFQGVQFVGDVLKAKASYLV